MRSKEWNTLVNDMTGVPQESLLGPVLITLYIHDLDAGINSNVIVFADYTNNGDLDASIFKGEPAKLYDW